ncbi:MAG: protease complex subunit PrcB family protein [Lachnospiraceae bacterium]|nr:protease complex subunit PrcB family protein [Lachnospiraceae bacterium]
MSEQMQWKKSDACNSRGSRCLCLFLLLLVSVSLAFGCAKNREDSEMQEIAYTVVSPQELPQELKTIIDQKKEGEFKLTYLDGDYLYIAVGYGRQTTGGYSIQIPRVYLKDGSIVFESILLGPEGEEPANISYPYAVVKTEKREEPVLFQ